MENVVERKIREMQVNEGTPEKEVATITINRKTTLDFQTNESSHDICP